MIFKPALWRDLAIGGGVLVGGLLIYDAISKGLGFEGVKSTMENLGGIIGESIIAVPEGIARALGAEEFGSRLYQGTIGRFLEEENIIERTTWGELEPGEDLGVIWLGPLPIPVSAPEVAQLGPMTKDFIIKAAWRTDPEVRAMLEPWMIKHLEAERAKYVRAGLIPA